MVVCLVVDHAMANMTLLSVVFALTLCAFPFAACSSSVYVSPFGDDSNVRDSVRNICGVSMNDSYTARDDGAAAAAHLRSTEASV